MEKKDDLGEHRQIPRDRTTVFSLWEREVAMVDDVAKKTKQEINTDWIFSPSPERAAALASADPERVTDVTGFF